MKSIFKLFGMFALAALIGFSFAACDSGGGDDGDPALEGVIHIAAAAGGTAITTANTGDTLYAVYSGSETVSYQWKKDGSAIADAASASYIPAEAGEYTVTVSAAGFVSKTSAKVTVTGETIELEGTVHIAAAAVGTAITSANTGAALYAVYSGSETVSYQWKKGGNDVSGATSASYTPGEAGDYTVTVSAAGFAPKTSAAVIVSVSQIPGYFDNLSIEVSIIPVQPGMIVGWGIAWRVLKDGVHSLTHSTNQKTKTIDTEALRSFFSVTIDGVSENISRCTIHSEGLWFPIDAYDIPASGAEIKVEYTPDGDESKHLFYTYNGEENDNKDEYGPKVEPFVLTVVY